MATETVPRTDEAASARRVALDNWEALDTRITQARAIAYLLSTTRDLNEYPDLANAAWAARDLLTDCADHLRLVHAGLVSVTPPTPRQGLQAVPGLPGGAPAAEPAGAPIASCADLHSFGLHAGAAAVPALLQTLGKRADEDLRDYSDANPDRDGEDGRDYRVLAGMVRASLDANLQHQDPAHVEGYLRALTDLFCIVADGCGPGDDWEPLKSSAACFHGAGLPAADVAQQTGASHG